MLSPFPFPLHHVQSASDKRSNSSSSRLGFKGHLFVLLLFSPGVFGVSFPGLLRFSNHLLARSLASAIVQLDPTDIIVISMRWKATWWPVVNFISLLDFMSPLFVGFFPLLGYVSSISPISSADSLFLVMPRIDTDGLNGLNEKGANPQIMNLLIAPQLCSLLRSNSAQTHPSVDANPSFENEWHPLEGCFRLAPPFSLRFC